VPVKSYVIGAATAPFEMPPIIPAATAMVKTEGSVFIDTPDQT